MVTVLKEFISASLFLNIFFVVDNITHNLPFTPPPPLPPPPRVLHFLKLRNHDDIWPLIRLILYMKNITQMAQSYFNHSP